MKDSERILYDAVADLTLAKVPATTDKILEVINPTRKGDAPFIAYSLKSILDDLTGSMSEGQKSVLKFLDSSIKSESRHEEVH